MPDQMPKKGTKIVVAMSGGVDSSVAAAWLKQLGYDVIGVSLQLSDISQETINKFGSCCSLKDISDAKRVAAKIGIPFYVANMEEKFQEEVIDDFIDEYLNGRTPNPCVRCNEKVKWRHLMDWALDLGAEYLATGHYANVRRNTETGGYLLTKGKDTKKDQSYFLFTLTQEDLARTLFPLGELQKTKVREIAQELQLNVHDKKESQEICFVQDRSYKDFIKQSVAPDLIKPGQIVDKTGKVLANHQGLHNFTIGQRRGLGALSQEALYVTRIEHNYVTVGPEEELYSKHCSVFHVNWIGEPNLQTAPTYLTKIRYRAKESAAKLFPLLDNRVEVEFEIPQRAITPGQAIVFYQEDQVMGGGWIEEVVT